jgi:anti-sigma factor RsiW
VARAPLRCEDVAEALPGIMDGSLRADRRVIRHVDRCLRCQAELAQYRKLLRALRQLRSQVPPPPPGGVARALSGLEQAAERRAIRSALRGRKVAYLAGLGVAAAAAGAAGAAVLVSRGRGHGDKVGLLS